MTFHKHSEKIGDSFITTKFYHIPDWNPEKYEELSKQYEYHVGLVEDLVLELTRAANYICDMVRASLDPSYRIRDGILIITSGPYMDFTYKSHRVLYRGVEKNDIPYPGINAFKKIRFSRDFYFGEKDSSDA